MKGPVRVCIIQTEQIWFVQRRWQVA